MQQHQGLSVLEKYIGYTFLKYICYIQCIYSKNVLTNEKINEKTDKKINKLENMTKLINKQWSRRFMLITCQKI